MVGGKATPRKDKALKVSSGMLVKTGQILARSMPVYKAGKNVKGQSTIYALCPGNIYFTKKKTSHGKIRTFLNIAPLAETPAK